MLERPFSPEEQSETARLFEEGIAVGPDDNEPGFVCQSAKVRFPDEEEIKAALEKSSIDEVFERIKKTEKLTGTDDYDNARFAILSITEGKYHQVKRMFAAAGNKVVYLKRLSMGQLKLDSSLEPGQYRTLTEEERALLQ